MYSIEREIQIITDVVSGMQATLFNLRMIDFIDIDRGLTYYPLRGYWLRNVME